MLDKQAIDRFFCYQLPESDYEFDFVWIVRGNQTRSLKQFRDACVRETKKHETSTLRTNDN